MSIHKRTTSDGKTRYRVMWRDRFGKQHSATCSSMSEARLLDAEKRLHPAGLIAPQDAASMTVTDAFVEWFELQSREWADKTFTNRKSMFDKWIGPLLGKTLIGDLTKRHVREFRGIVYERSGSAYTANKAVKELSACLGACVKNDILDSNPCRDIGSLPVEPAKHRALTIDEVEQLRRVMPTTRDRLIVSLLAYAGLRPGELCGLAWRHVGESLILVEQSAQAGKVKSTKTGKSRSIPIMPALADDLAEVSRGADDEYVVTGDKGGILPWHFWSQTIWKQACAETSITARAYDLRHTFASLVLAHGMSVPAAAAVLGHARSSMTLDVYSHAYAEGHLATPTSLDDAIRAARTGRAAKDRRHLRAV